MYFKYILSIGNNIKLLFIEGSFMAGQIIYDNGKHRCIVFSDLVEGEDGIQSNQFLIIHTDEQGQTEAAVIDPGGDLTYTALTLAVLKYTDIRNVKYVLGSHQDPDIIASMPRWLLHTEAKIVVSRLWERFVPHLNSSFTTGRLREDLSERLIGLPDHGGVIKIAGQDLYVLPAHFLHSVGNFQFYDPVSKILFSGDMGASIVGDAYTPVENFEAHIPNMRGFHRRYMVSQKATQLWADGVRQLDVEKMVPQHGSAFVGQAMIHKFLDWISGLECGVDLINASTYDYQAMIQSRFNIVTDEEEDTSYLH